MRRILRSNKGATTFDYLLVTAAVLGVGIPILNNQMGGRLLGGLQGNRRKMVDFISQNKKERVPNRWFSKERMPNPDPDPDPDPNPDRDPPPGPGRNPPPGPGPDPGTNPRGGPSPDGGPQADGGGGGSGGGKRNFGENNGGNSSGGNDSPTNGGPGSAPKDGLIGGNDLPVTDAASPFLGDSSSAERGSSRRGGRGDDEILFGEAGKLDSVRLARYRPETMLAADIRKKNGGGSTRRVGLEGEASGEEEFDDSDAWDWWKVLRFLLLILLVLVILWVILTQARQARR